MIQIFGNVLTQDEIEFMQKGSGIHGFNIIVNLMEQKILNEISRLFSGESVISDAIAIVDKMKSIETAGREQLVESEG
ncbi:hypothetical protein [Dyadobacter sp. 22481]|uniref:hypothetical protein n=1 Tax=Dyadobacter sp. 22481 TaxID=3453926 RepID=UPI003F8369B6